MNNTLLGLCIIFPIFILTGLFIFFPEFYKGSNADIGPYPDAILVCSDDESNVTVTWEYSYLSEEDAFNGFMYAERNNCTFQHARFSIKYIQEEILKNGTE
jgi:hypothetical protein